MGRRAPARSFSSLLLRFWTPAVLYAAMVLFIGSRPHLQSPVSFFGADKVAHAGMYLGLGLLLTRATRASIKSPMPAALLAICLGILVGTGDELNQSRVPGRSCDVFDLLADTAGLALVPLVVRAFTRD
jgi:VanZ family protein